jgi:hypothetical protein
MLITCKSISDGFATSQDNMSLVCPGRRWGDKITLFSTTQFDDVQLTKTSNDLVMKPSASMVTLYRPLESTVRKYVPLELNAALWTTSTGPRLKFPNTPRTGSLF